ncbi:MAG: hypothetical protein JO010_03870 [Alphaproteobacteria bacterium]|nr:hypothetical protein [Alphaproteobacteria bacterium]
MMTAGREIWVDHGEAALGALDRCLAQGADKLGERIAEAVRRLVVLRDGLIARRRSGESTTFERDRLDRTNAIISLVVGAEFPIQGLHRERVQGARDALAAMLGKP